MLVPSLSALQHKNIILLLNRFEINNPAINRFFNKCKRLKTKIISPKLINQIQDDIIVFITLILILRETIAKIY